MQLVVRVLDKYDGIDVERKSKTTGRGDVIEVVEDDHEWGSLDLTNPSWIILRVPISTEKALAMKSGDQGEFNPTARIRSFALNLEILAARGYAIPTRGQAMKVRDDYEAETAEFGASRSEIKHSAKYARATAIFDITEADFDAAWTAKPLIEDRAIIG